MIMRKVVKISIWTVAIVLVLAIGAGVVIYLNLNSIVRRAIEKQSAASLNLPTKLASADVGLFSGELKMGQFEIGSPAGFKSERFFDLTGGSVAVTYGEMRKQPIHVKQIILDKPKLIVEHANLKFNIQAVMDGVPKTPEDKQMKLIIDELQIKNATVVLVPGLPGLTKEIVVPIPSITLKNIGNADGNRNGAAIKQVALMTFVALAGQAAEYAGVPLDLNKELSKMLGGVSQQLGAEFDKQFKGITSTLTKGLPGQAGQVIQGATKDLQKQIGGGNDLTKGLQDVLGGGKKKKK